MEGLWSMKTSISEGAQTVYQDGFQAPTLENGKANLIDLGSHLKESM